MKLQTVYEPSRFINILRSRNIRKTFFEKSGIYGPWGVTYIYIHLTQFFFSLLTKKKGGKYARANS